MDYLMIAGFIFGLLQAIARLIKTPEAKDVQNRLLKGINILLSASREDKR